MVDYLERGANVLPLSTPGDTLPSASEQHTRWQCLTRDEQFMSEQYTVAALLREQNGLREASDQFGLPPHILLVRYLLFDGPTREEIVPGKWFEVTARWGLNEAGRGSLERDVALELLYRSGLYGTGELLGISPPQRVFSRYHITRKDLGAYCGFSEHDIDRLGETLGVSSSRVLRLWGGPLVERAVIGLGTSSVVPRRARIQESRFRP